MNPSKEDIKQVPCPDPECEAEVGQDCWTSHGEPRFRSHFARMQLAQRVPLLKDDRKLS
ncbi:hypothetical protein GCM10027610_081700 [Dactylosporangium cerinum]